jgi:hypothetical protein
MNDRSRAPISPHGIVLGFAPGRLFQGPNESQMSSVCLVICHSRQSSVAGGRGRQVIGYLSLSILVWFSILLFSVKTIYCHLSWFPSGKTDSETIFWLILLETTYLPQTVPVSGKMATHLVATVMLYLSVFFVNII